MYMINAIVNMMSDIALCFLLFYGKIKESIVIHNKDDGIV